MKWLMICSLLVSASILLTSCQKEIEKSTPITEQPNQVTAPIDKEILVVKSTQDLSNSINRKVQFKAIYQNPGKGCRYLDCGFEKIYISDYSFYTQIRDGSMYRLTTDLENGDSLLIEALLLYFPGSKSLVKTHPVRQEALPPVETIDGQKYYVYPPSYSIKNGKVISK